MAQVTPQAQFSGLPGSWKAWTTPVTTPTTFTFPIACPTPQQRLQQCGHGNRLGQMLKEYRVCHLSLSVMPLEEQKADIKSGSHTYKPPLTAVPSDSRGKIAILPHTGREVTITANTLPLKDIR